MYIKMRSVVILILLLTTKTGFAQALVHPNYSLKSHETLEISKIDFNSDKTQVFLTIENRIEKGNFCADRNIFLIDSKGRRHNLENSSGIPVCPDTYIFKSVGEKLEFVLTFPALDKDVEWIDIIEDCSENCFSFYEVTLDSDLNRKIDNAFLLVENNQPQNALVSFIKIAEEAERNNRGAKGLIYLNIIKLAQETGNTLKAAEWYNKLSGSSIPNAGLYIRHLNTQGIKY